MITALLLLACVDAVVVPAGSGADADLDGWTTNEGDCADEDPTVHPAAAEVCNERDDDCDELVDMEDPSLSSWTWVDADGDGSPGTWGRSCEIGERLDCDDADPLVHGDAIDVPCDGIDSDCDSTGEGENVVVLDEREYATFEEAFEVAAAGDRLLVCPGTWTVGTPGFGIEVPWWLDGITIASVSGAAEDTILDGGGDGPVLFNESTDLTLEDLTFQGGTGYLLDATYGGAIYSQSSGGLTIDGCVIRDNRGGYGSAIAARGPAIEIRDTRIIDNVTEVSDVVAISSVDATATFRFVDVELGPEQLETGDIGISVYALEHYEAVFERLRAAEDDIAAVELETARATVDAVFTECEFEGLRTAILTDSTGTAGSSIRVERSRIVRSGVDSIAAVRVGDGIRFESVESDWGEDADDNLGPDLGVASVPYYGFGASASFVCEPTAPCE